MDTGLGFSAFVVSDLYQAGHGCDGQPFIAELFYVVVENESGRRFRHSAHFNGTEHLISEEGESHFPDYRDQASEKAQRLADKVNEAIQAGQPLNLDLWEEVEPAYGSDEYIEQGTELKRLFAEKTEGLA